MTSDLIKLIEELNVIKNNIKEIHNIISETQNLINKTITPEIFGESDDFVLAIDKIMKSLRMLAQAEVLLMQDIEDKIEIHKRSRK